MVSSCRLCLTEDPEEKLKNVFQCNVEHAEDTLVDVLFWVFSVEIDVTDAFSKYICSECIQLIEYILQVKNTFLKNQENLRSHLLSQDSESFKTQSSENAFKTGSNNGPTSYCTTPTNSPNSKSRYHSKNVYGSSSPRVRVSLSAIDAICPMNVTLQPLENTQEYLRYRRLKNGSFKKRKYRHFNMDGALLNDICNSLEEIKNDSTDPLTDEIGVTTDFGLSSKDINSEEKILCACKRNLASLKSSAVDVSPRGLKINDRIEKGTDDTLEDDNFLDIIGITKHVKSVLLSPGIEEEHDWTTMTFKKDASTNTESARPETKNVAITAKVLTNTTGTLTKRFKQMKKKDVVKVNVNSLVGFGPKVVLKPLEDVLDEINYKEIDNFRYIKNDPSSLKDETEEILEKNLESEIRDESEQDVEDNDFNKNQQCIATESEQDVEDSDFDEHQQCIATIKKQRFLDYYKNFSSFAVRELIAGRNIRENAGGDGNSSVYKITNVCSVFVCDFCSKSFLSKISLELHYKRAHKYGKESRDSEVTVIDLDNDKCKTPENDLLPKQFKKRPGRLTGMSKSNTKIKTNVKNSDCTFDANVETSRNNIKGDSKSSSNNANGKTRFTNLKRNVKKINYNINDIIKLKTRSKQILLKEKGKRRRRRKLIHTASNGKEKKNLSYIWNRKSLGKYSAISYYKTYVGDEKAPNLEPALEPAYCDIIHKPDITLNDTIQKLAHRLDSVNASLDTCDDEIDILN